MASASTPFSPEAFKNMAQYKKHAIRQGLLPATDCEGRHSSEDISHQLAKDILDIHHTGLFQDFHNWRSINSPTMPQSQKDLDDLLQTYFNATEYRHLSIPSRTNFSKYLQSYYQIANDYNAQKFQCQYTARSVLPNTSSCQCIPKTRTSTRPTHSFSVGDASKQPMARIT